MNYKFEWDKKKNTLNKRKHGVSFEEVLDAFYDPKKLEMYDKEHSLFEVRWFILGLSGLTVYKVFFTERDGSVRIFSARKADRDEEEEYFYGYN